MLWQRVPVVAFVNSHYAGYAPETARQLVDEELGVDRAGRYFFTLL